ncbi:MAG: QueT transporter family protein [Oscillospiraceae bacterium]|nr:QueT transporter family protein [Oscillospiraceae bacterium]
MSKIGSNAKDLTRLAVVAALYAALTIALSGLSFGPVQFRIAELLTLLCFYRKDYSVALILGCFIANCFSPMALMDMVFGTVATAVAVIPMFYVKNIWVASLLPVISNAVIIAVELYIAFKEPLWMSMLTVGAGELVVITIVGCPLFRCVLEKNKHFMELIGSQKKAANKTA